MKKLTDILKEVRGQEIATYDGPEGLTKIYKQPDGSYYGINNKFDFTAETKNELNWKLSKWNYIKISGEIK